MAARRGGGSGKRLSVAQLAQRKAAAAKSARNHAIKATLTSHKGSLHRALGVPKGKKIPKSALLTTARSGKGWLAKRAALVYRLHYGAFKGR